MNYSENHRDTKDLSDDDLLKTFTPASEVEEPKDIGEFEEEELERLRQTGIDLTTPDRTGTFIQTNHSVLKCDCQTPGVELLPITEALKKYDGLKDYWWKLISAEKDPFTREADQKLDNGYFIRALPGEKVIYPLQTCLYIRNENVAQHIHNIVVAEEGSELHIITGCSTHPHLKSGMHIGISEFYVKKGAKLTFTMIHNWGENVYVRPRTGIWVEEDGAFLSNYISLKGVKSVQTFPTATLAGPNALARFNSVIVAPEGSDIDTGAKVILKAPGSRSEIISRAISFGGRVVARGHLVGLAANIKAHLECQGLILAEHGVIHAIPELEAHVADVDMSHEAAVGRIAQEEIEYLMARGLDEEEATSTIVRGFLDVKINGLPPELNKELQEVVEECRKGM
ncbi:MAG: SufD family Fe-S cluster assembly protein [Deltaproteobacteria bacterium]|nr:SufD family Fe-S cluster assembly protein [Deltaproteobacteria bacterium]MBW1718293.1 SufD family Fe-S cluster assembly protein [Deltaproteobacteria bacterium]MBW1932078.1 SufD family Fe-S cluster assembly protein [Deltaproteobacteria bacterium]MBW1937583.1 SufD family Fe-S cluster assembly protein [Deltaproteobacteria bacterium]MBW1963617.1 SufD family Fe-S cluster assembly protein [Deltaproteobacteria bacterium]